MGYLADIVFDARERHRQLADPTCFEQTTESLLLEKPGMEIGERAQEQRHRKSSHGDHQSSAISKSDSRLSDGQVTQPENDVTNSAGEHAGVTQHTTNLELHQHLLQLSQQTLIKRSEKILSQQQASQTRPFEKSSPASDAVPREAILEKKETSGSQPRATVDSKRADIPPGNTVTHHAHDNSTSVHTQVNQSNVQLNHQETQLTRNHIAGQVHHHFATKTQPVGTVTDTPKSHSPGMDKAPQTNGEKVVTPGKTPQLRIGQINVVVESSNAEQERRGPLNRDSDSGSTIFLRSL